MDAWLARLVDAHAGAEPDVARLCAALAEADGAAWLEHARFDATVPYGRTVVATAAGLEVMIAGWSRGRPCAPHDHGPGQGAVRVLQGRARHRGFVLEAGALRVVVDEVLGVDAMLRCPRGLVHQMQDAGAARPLVTLHLYAGQTSPMTVYDLEHARTQWLDGGCGAWPRPDGDAKVLAWRRGLVRATDDDPADPRAARDAEGDGSR